MDDLEYWKECISLAGCDCDLNLTDEQLNCLAESVSAGHENYGIAFYSPPDSDRYADIEREWERKYKALLAQFENTRAMLKPPLSRRWVSTRMRASASGNTVRFFGTAVEQSAFNSPPRAGFFLP